MLDEAAGLSDAAWRLHVEALIVSATRLHDLDVPKRTLGRQTEVHGDLDAAIAELIAGGWWEDRGDTWYIGLRFPGWQRSSEQVAAKRRTDREAQERKRLHDKADHSRCLLRSPCRRASSADNADESVADNAHESVRSAEKSREEKSSYDREPTSQSNGRTNGASAWPDVRADLRTRPDLRKRAVGS
jgi:hypothetical protein